MQLNLVDIVLALRERVYLNGISSYKELLSSNVPESNIDEYSSAIRFYQSLNEQDKEHIHYLISQVICDTTADIFAWLDGAYFINGQSDNGFLELKYEKNEKRINRYLADIWLAIDQGEDIDELRDFFKDL